MALLAALPVRAAPLLAGDLIRNTATASYEDAGSGRSETIYSNTVEVEVSAVAGVQVTPAQSLLGAPGATLDIPHVVGNAGNIPDSYDLSVANLSSGTLVNGKTDNLNGLALAILSDSDCNGVPDAAAAITHIGPLAPGMQACVVVRVQLPATAVANDAIGIAVKAASQTDPLVSATAMDVVSVSERAVLSAVKALSASEGRAPSGPYLYSLVLRNNGNDVARNIMLVDPLPAGMTYRPGSARWSGASLSDAAGGDPSGLEFDAGVTLPGMLTLKVASMLAGQAGKLEFEVDVEPGLASGAVITNQARLCYHDGAQLLPSAGCGSGSQPTAGGTYANGKQVVSGPFRVVGPMLVVDKSVAQTTAAAGDVLRYSLTLRNDGDGEALPIPISVNGVAQTAVLLRDVIPANTSYEPGTLASDAAGTSLLLHAFGDGFSPTDAAWHRYYTPAAFPSGQVVDAVAVATPGLAPGGRLTARFGARLHANARGWIYNQGEAYADDGSAPHRVTSPTVASEVASAAPIQIAYYTDASWTATTPFSRRGEPLYVQADAPVCNWNPLQPDYTNLTGRAAMITLRSTLTGDQEQYLAEESGPNTGLYRILDNGFGAGYVPTQDVAAHPAASGDGIMQVAQGDTIVAQISCSDLPVSQGGSGAVAAAEADILLDPQGIVFNAHVPAEGVPGVRVSLYDAASQSPAQVYCDAARSRSAPNAGLTGSADFQQPGCHSPMNSPGFFQFPYVQPGNYYLCAEPPSGYLFPTLLPKSDVIANSGRAVNDPGSFDQSGDGTPAGCGGVFSVATGIVAVDLPVDPNTDNLPLSISKEALNHAVDVGGFANYRIRVRNNNSTPVFDGQLADALPLGFKFVPGSARLVAGSTSTAIADPSGSPGPALTFTLPQLAANQEVALTYRARVTVNAPLGDGTNTAQAVAGGLASNRASARVTVLPGILTDKGILFGKVYADCHRNRLQDPEDVGIPGVRIYLEDGTYAVTDSEGKYSIYGVSARTHVLKLDDSTLPRGAEMLTLSNRNAGVGWSRFADVKKGELHRADFAEGSCSPEVMQDVAARRRQGETGLAEVSNAMQRRLDVAAVINAPGDPKALPASGTVAGASSQTKPEVFQPVAPVPGEGVAELAAGDEALLRAPMALESLLPSLTDNKFAILDLKDGDVLPYAQTNVRLKGVAGAEFRLSVNGKPVPASRVGKRSTLEDKRLTAWEYIGVDLVPGENTLEAAMLDPMGNVRGKAEVRVMAPDQLARLLIEGDDAAPSDGKAPQRVTVRLVDQAGLPVTARTHLTLESTLGRWQVKDLNPDEPGVQVFLEGGKANYVLLAPNEPGDALVRISSGVLKAERQVVFVPNLRPLIANGVIEGVFRLNKLDLGKLLPTRRRDSFEQEITRYSREFNGGKSVLAGRAALYLKGKVKGDYLLTLSYDSDKDTNERLFRDIQPDEYYPVYGDASVRGFDAQSTGRLYVRVDKGRSYFLYGDYQTAQAGLDRQVTNYSRTFTGAKYHYEDKTAMLNAFASHDTVRQVVDIFPANGTSGPFYLSRKDRLEQSERVEVLTLDRNQPSVILKLETLQRFADYDLEPLSGRLMLHGPVPSLDQNLNPLQIRVTYEADQGGDKYWVAGVDGQVKLGDKVQVGGVLVSDQNPNLSKDLANPTLKDLVGVNASVKLGERTALSAEVARTRSEAEIGIGAVEEVSGTAARVELRHDAGDLQARVYAQRADAEFNNTGSTLGRGRLEAGARANYRLSPKTSLAAEAIHSEDLATDGKRDGLLLSMSRKLSDHVTAEVGLRHTRETTAPAQPTSVQATAPGSQPADVTALRIKLATTLPQLPNARLYAEYEQDLQDAEQRMAALGGDYALSSKLKVYGRYEFISTLGGQWDLNPVQSRQTAVFGVRSDYMQDGSVFSEYRARDAFNGREAEASIGLRNGWQLSEGLKLTTQLEKIKAISGSSAYSGESTAVALGLDYTLSERWKASGRLERRLAQQSDSWLLTGAAAVKLDRDWTGLAKLTYSLLEQDAGEYLQDRVQLGVAYRPVDSNALNLLARLEHRGERNTTALDAPLETDTEMFSLHVNYQPARAHVVSGLVAARWTRDRSLGLDAVSATAQLASLRWTWDVTERWDLGLIGSYYLGDGASRYGTGVEAGYLFQENLRLALGYNAFGFRDDEMAELGNFDRGVYFGLGYKFDEDIFPQRLQK